MTARLYGRRLRQERLINPSDRKLDLSKSASEEVSRTEWWLQYGFSKDVLQLSRPNTRNDSPGHQLFHVTEGSESPFGVIGNRVRTSSLSTPDLLRVETHHSTNLPSTKSFDDTLTTLRIQVNNHTQGSESRVRDSDSRGRSEEFNGFHFPDDLQSDKLRARNLQNGNIFVNGTALFPNVSFTRKDRSKIYPDTPRIGINGYEVELEDNDISKMAAQRDQQRGTSRYIRGMMAPVTSKDEDARKQSTSRKSSVPKQRGDTGMDFSDGLNQEPSVRTDRDLITDGTVNFGETLTVRRLRDLSEGGQGRKQSLQREDVLNDGSRDIMAQSIRRQTMKTKSGLSEDEVLYGSRLKTNQMIRISNDNGVLRPDKSTFPITDRDSGNSRLTSFSRGNPASREDVQILNLHGFMDSNFGGHSAAVLRQDSRWKSRMRNLKRLEDISPIDTGRKASRQGYDKLRKHRGKHLTRLRLPEGDDDVVLKDIDDVDEKMTKLVIAPKQSYKDAVGRPITFEQVIQIRQLLTGNAVVPLPNEWLIQSFRQNKNPNLSYGLLQKKGGPCGVLASVQAHMMKSLIFGSRLSPSTSIASPLRPSSREWAWALTVAITEILWRISEAQKAVLALPDSFSHISDHGVGRYTPDGLTETITLYEFTSEASLYSAVEAHLQVFTSDASSGCVLLLYSALLTRGLERVAVDMDAGGSYLINAHGYASQEIVNLMLTGQATTNTFDGDHTFGDEGQNSSTNGAMTSTPVTGGEFDFTSQRRKSESGESKMVLRGIKKRSEIGLLSLFEHYGSCKVGNHLKSPEYPVWVVCSESHYSVVFARDQKIVRNEFPSEPFDVYYYDGLALQEDEIRLTIDVYRDLEDATLTPPLEFCLRTKWPKAHISWNGTDPIL